MDAETFVATTWNAGGGEPVGPTDADVVEVLTKIFRLKTTVFFGQEFQEKHDRLFLREIGFEMHRYGPECIVAWNPDVWTKLATDDVKLNPNNPFYRVGKGERPIYCYSPAVLLGNKLGLTLDALSLHMPSSVQEKDPPKNRIAATREAARTLTERKRESRCHAQDFAGDDNVDETGAWGPWDFMLGGATGLRQLQAPQNTLGKRKVDDHRVAGLRDLGGKVVKGPTHHNAHVRTLRFKD
jgi:hypothetical protein